MQTLCAGQKVWLSATTKPAPEVTNSVEKFKRFSLGIYGRPAEQIDEAIRKSVGINDDVASIVKKAKIANVLQETPETPQPTAHSRSNPQPSDNGKDSLVLDKGLRALRSVMEDYRGTDRSTSGDKGLTSPEPSPGDRLTVPLKEVRISTSPAAGGASWTR
jgi:hypothetical protein